MKRTSKFGNVVGAKFIDERDRSSTTDFFSETAETRKETTNSKGKNLEQTKFFGKTYGAKFISKDSNEIEGQFSNDSESKDSGAFKTTSFFS